jgi:hypothetical protein
MANLLDVTGLFWGTAPGRREKLEIPVFVAAPTAQAVYTAVSLVTHRKRVEKEEKGIPTQAAEIAMS